MKPDSPMDLAESMPLVQVFGGGVAALNDRTRSKAIDNILARDLGVEPEKLKGYSADASGLVRPCVRGRGVEG